MNKIKFLSAILVIFSLLFVGCKDEVYPKPKGLLSLKYDLPKYENVDSDCGFVFSKNKNALLRKTFKNKTCGYVLLYPDLGASIYISHREVKGDLVKLLKDAQNLTQEHVVKAEEIIPKSYHDSVNNVSGMFYEIIGDAASQSQFYVTDSTSNFLLGSLYFNVKPNYDSIYPAAKYLQNDMVNLMETTRWK